MSAESCVRHQREPSPSHARPLSALVPLEPFCRAASQPHLGKALTLGLRSAASTVPPLAKAFFCWEQETSCFNFLNMAEQIFSPPSTLM